MSGDRARSHRGDRPLLVLGISEVVVLESEPLVPATVHRVSAWGRWTRNVAVADDAADRIGALAERFDIVWASEWGHNAHTALLDVLRLPQEPWPFLPVQFDKLAVIRAYAADASWAWVDDPLVDLTGDRPSDASGVVVRVESGVGISGVDAQALRDQVDEIA